MFPWWAHFRGYLSPADMRMYHELPLTAVEDKLAGVTLTLAPGRCGDIRRQYAAQWSAALIDLGLGDGNSI